MPPYKTQTPPAIPPSAQRPIFASGIFTQVTQVPLQRIKQGSVLMSDPTQSKPFGQKIIAIYSNKEEKDASFDGSCPLAKSQRLESPIE